jgi:RNA-binding protein
MAARVPSKSLSGKQKAYLRALAHELKPVVQIGKDGWTSAVAAQLDDALEAHELTKVKVGQRSPLEPGELLVPLEQATGATVVQALGRILVVYRPRAHEPGIVLPSPAPQDAAGPPATAR